MNKWSKLTAIYIAGKNDERAKAEAEARALRAKSLRHVTRVLAIPAAAGLVLGLIGAVFAVGLPTLRSTSAPPPQQFADPAKAAQQESLQLSGAEPAADDPLGAPSAAAALDTPPGTAESDQPTTPNTLQLAGNATDAPANLRTDVDLEFGGKKSEFEAQPAVQEKERADRDLAAAQSEQEKVEKELQRAIAEKETVTEKEQAATIRQERLKAVAQTAKGNAAKEVEPPGNAVERPSAEGESSAAAAENAAADTPKGDAAAPQAIPAGDEQPVNAEPSTTAEQPAAAAAQDPATVAKQKRIKAVARLAKANKARGQKVLQNALQNPSLASQKNVAADQDHVPDESDDDFPVGDAVPSADDGDEEALLEELELIADMDSEEGDNDELLSDEDTDLDAGSAIRKLKTMNDEVKAIAKQKDEVNEKVETLKKKKEEVSRTLAQARQKKQALDAKAKESIVPKKTTVVEKRRHPQSDAAAAPSTPAADSRDVDSLLLPEQSTVIDLGLDVDLRQVEGRLWLEKARTLFRHRDYFAAKLIAAYLLGFDVTPGTRRAGEELWDHDDFPPLLKPNSLEQVVAHRILAAEPHSYLVWRQPITNGRFVDLAVEFSADGRCLAWADGAGVSLLVFSARPREAKLLPDGDVSAISFSPDGQVLAIAERDVGLTLWDVQSQRLTTTIETRAPIVALAFSPADDLLAWADEVNRITIWNVRRQERSRAIQYDGGVITDLSFRFDGQVLAVAGATGGITLWSPANGNLINAIPVGDELTRCVLFDDRGDRIFSGGASGHVRIWNAVTGQYEGTIHGHGGPLYDLDISAPTDQIVGAAENGIEVWDLCDGMTFANFGGQRFASASVDVSPDGKTIAVVSADGLKLWNTGAAPRADATANIHSVLGRAAIAADDVARATDPVRLDGLSPLRSIPGHTAAVINALYPGDSSSLLSCGRDKTIRLWDLSNGRQSAIFEGHSDSVLNIAYDGNNEILASACRDATVKIWDLRCQEELTTLKAHWAAAYCVRFSPDGRTMASGSQDGTVSIWDVATWTTRFTLTGHTGTVIALSFSPDGGTLASASRDGTIRLWDAATGAERRTLDNHRGAVFCLSYHRGGRMLASGSRDGSVKVWNVASGNEMKSYSGHLGTVYGVCFHPDKDIIVSGGGDRTIRLWDLNSPREIGYFDARDSRVLSVSFSPDGHTVCSTHDDGTVRLWTFGWPARIDYRPYAMAVTGAVTFAEFSFQWRSFSQPSAYYNLWPNSHLDILARSKNDEDRDPRLFWLYLGGGNIPSAKSIVAILPESERERPRTALHTVLCAHHEDALDRGDAGAAAWYAKQWEEVE